MKPYYRKSTPKVINGKVQEKNSWKMTPKYNQTPAQLLFIDKEKPGKGYRHLIRKKELRAFINLLPEWKHIATGLKAIVLASGDCGLLGWHDYGVIGLCAWDREIKWYDCEPDFYHEHREIFDKLNIPCQRNKNQYIIEFDEHSAKAFQLIHVFIHELGHHLDRMTTRSKFDAARGEAYAEKYARQFENRILDLYQRHFGL